MTFPRRTIMSITTATLLGAGVLVAMPAPSYAATPPTITSTAGSSKAKNAAGWYSQPVIVTFACSDGSAPLTSPCPEAVFLGTAGADQVVSRTVTNGDGLSATATESDIDIDLVAPSVKVAGVKKNKTYHKRQKATCQAVDDVSGVASCTLTETVKQKQGFKKYTVFATATDLAGHVSAARLGYKVAKKKNNK